MELIPVPFPPGGGPLVLGPEAFHVHGEAVRIGLGGEVFEELADELVERNATTPGRLPGSSEQSIVQR
jgi:hypothetical protein